DKGCYLPDWLQSSSQHLAAYYALLLSTPYYDHYRNALTPKEEGGRTIPEWQSPPAKTWDTLAAIVMLSAHLHHAISSLLIPINSSRSDFLPQTLNNDSLQLPEGLHLQLMKFGEVTGLGVFYSSFVAKAVRFGTFQPKVVNTSEVKTHGDNFLIQRRSLSMVI
ncbi:hypothetical protein Celaphus_00003403, partial [Cervus elaphus hippelaphus]